LNEWIDRDGRLADRCASLPGIIGLDTEFHRTDTFLPRLALVQIGAGGDALLVDPLAEIDLSPLSALLAAPEHVCVAHSAGEDLEVLTSAALALPAELFDTQIAAAFAGLGAGVGYQRLVRELTGIELAKTETRSDWLRRPLSTRQLEYAAQDVVHLPALHAELSARLASRGYAAWCAQDCRRLLERARLREPDREPQLGLRGAAGWPLERQALLRRLLLWREEVARRIDRPRPWILDDARALDLAARPPRDAAELAERTRGQRALRSPQRAELAQLLAEPLQAHEMMFEPVSATPDRAARECFAALKDIVARRATELDLPDALLCPRRHLERLLATRRWPSALDGWRREVLHDALMAALPD
jgi:ribonuclease D